jgi:Fe2+ transport system protein FeoA
MGFFPGCRLRVLHNDPDDLNMVVAVDDARFALAKHNARQILVR